MDRKEAIRVCAEKTTQASGLMNEGIEALESSGLHKHGHLSMLRRMRTISRDVGEMLAETHGDMERKGK